MGVLVFLLALIGVKASSLQLLHGQELRALAQKQYKRAMTQQAARGVIQDRFGRVLARSVPVDSIFAEPRRIFDAREIADALAPILEVDPERLFHRLDNDRAFIWLRRRVSPQIAEEIRALRFPGIRLTQEYRRVYPNQHLAGQLLGTVSVDGAGQSGLERAFDQVLQPKMQKRLGFRDAKGRRLMLDTGFDLDLLRGDHIHLTLDASLQNHTENVLAKLLEDTQARAAWAVVLEPQTGAILAIANAPLLNLNAIGQAPSRARRNYALSTTFEPGSTFNIITVASALEACR